MQNNSTSHSPVGIMDDVCDGVAFGITGDGAEVSCGVVFGFGCACRCTICACVISPTMDWWLRLS